jgi:enoyl-CoA hydratase/carnithine racemase
MTDRPRAVLEENGAVKVNVEGGVALVSLNRPEKANTLSEEMISALSGALVFAYAAADVGAVVIASTSGSLFCTGHDLKELSSRRADADEGRAYFAEVMQSCSSLMQLIANAPKPVIAAIGGVATAAGCQLVASCDLAVASSSARFATPGVNIGLFCSTPAVAISRSISRKHAMEMLLTGELFDADFAMRVGLINRVVTPGSEIASAILLAQLIVSKSAQAIRSGKEAYERQSDMDLSEAYQLASQVMVDNLLLSDAKEGISAFIEKRRPQWNR